ncbi:hypothetical protein [Aureibaculum luteum]|uniref:hypothetical protein n=1 Tax=Aureibaculum luteum TaxID=1548456 RepID=UPI00130096AD|nr:hypothetical protein [Aureibaculum luteum]
MKKITLLLVTVFALSLSPQIYAADANTYLDTQNRRIYENNKSFTFIEEGITFSIFQNGEFDFYINPRRGMHVGVDLDNVSISYNSGYNYEPYVQYDDYGAIIQIENTPIYYDSYGRIIEAGDVTINYRSSRVNRIGSLNIYYNSYGGYSYQRGYVNVFNRHHVFHPFHNFFVLPFFNRSILSYKPYRNRYRPTRYSYYYGKNNHKRKYNRNYNSNRGYKKINSRVRTRNSSVARSKGVNSRSTSKRNNTVTRRQTAQRNTATRNNRNSTSSNRTTNKTPKRTVAQNRSVTPRNSRTINTQTRSTVQNRSERKPVQRTVRTQSRKANERSISQRNSSTKNRSSVQRTERKPVQRTTRTQTRNTSSSSRTASKRSTPTRTKSTVQRKTRTASTSPVKRSSSKRRM